MPVSAVMVMAFLIVLFLLLGVLIKHFKCYWLISGYNTASQEKKKNIDIEGLGKFMGNFCFLLAGIFFVGTVLDYLGFYYGLVISLGSLFLIIPFVLIRAQKYDHNTQTPDGKTKKSVLLIICLLSLVIFLIPAAMISYGVQEPEVIISSDTVDIRGMYGTSINFKDITGIFLKDEIPPTVRKTNGFDFGSILRGDFEMEGRGKIRLFIDRKKPPFILIEGQKPVILNFKDSKKTEELYKKTRDLRLNILVKNLKAPFMYNKELRHLALRSGLLSLDLKTI
jgi:hypothetical protein